MGLIQSLNIVEWRLGLGDNDNEGEGKEDRRNYIALSLVYRETLFSGICGIGILGAKRENLVISDFDLFRK